MTMLTEPITVSPPGRGEPRLIVGQPDLHSHVARFGRLPRYGADLIEGAARAGLTGRGGAGFPTARKLAAVATRPGPKVVVANGTEGEPLSTKDKTLLLCAPHLVLDGLDVSARALGARRRILCIERGRRDVVEAVATALRERGDRATEVVTTPRRYVSGQETALVDYLNGGLGKPTLTLPFDKGVDGEASLVDNVETLAHLALIARFGPAWYRTEGTNDDPGTTLTTVSGALRTPGVFEIPHGMSLREILRSAGAVRPRGILIGGYFGRWLPGSLSSRITLDRQSLNCHGASLGSGVIAVIDESSCAVTEIARVAAWFAASSAGQCGACTWGLRDLAGATASLSLGKPGQPHNDITRWSAMIKGRGACRLPDGAAGFIQSAIEVFAGEIADHEQGRCGRQDHHLLPVPDQDPWR